MGICLGWEQLADITPQAWEQVCTDFRKLAGPYQAELNTRRENDRARSPLPRSLASMIYPKAPQPVFEVATATDEAMEVIMDPSRRGGRTEEAWRLERLAGERWSRQQDFGSNGLYQGELLMAALLLVERHAPGVVQITQDDYEPGCWAQAASWMETVVGGTLTAPKGAGGAEIEDDGDVPTPQTRKGNTP